MTDELFERIEEAGFELKPVQGFSQIKLVYRNGNFVCRLIATGTTEGPFSSEDLVVGLFMDGEKRNEIFRSDGPDLLGAVVEKLKETAYAPKIA